MTECALGKLRIFKIYFLIWKIRLIMALLHWVIVGGGPGGIMQVKCQAHVVSANLEVTCSKCSTGVG